MLNEVNCPVSNEKVDENVTRAAAFFVVIFITTGILLKSYILLLIMAFDFGLRAFTGGKYSFIRVFAKKIAGYLKLSVKPIDAAPKKFAAGLGMGFSLVIGVSLFYGMTALVVISGSLLITCALLEFLFAICVGCYVYSLFVAPFYRTSIKKA